MSLVPEDIDKHHLFILSELFNGKKYVLSDSILPKERGLMYTRYFKDMMRLDYIQVTPSNVVRPSFKGIWLAHVYQSSRIHIIV